MILQALYEYYQRKAYDSESNIAPEGFEWKEIPFVIVIGNDGNFVALEDTREGDGKKKRAKKYLLPKSVGRPGSNGWMTSFLLWDHYGFVLGHARSETEKDQVMAKKQFTSFIKKIIDLPQEVKDDEGVSKVIRFYDQGEYEKVTNSEKWEECAKIVGCNLSFRLDGENVLIPCRNCVRTYVASQCGENADGVAGLCLISGEKAAIARIHSGTPINKDSKKFVSFQKSSGYDSYGKEQGYNAPISKSAEFAYTTALNMMLAKDSKNKVQVGDTTTVFWSKTKDVFEEAFPAFFAFPPKDDPDADVRAVKALYDGVFTGHVGDDAATKFYVLGLAPNAARISVRFWHNGTIRDFAEKIKQHFDDLKIIRSPKDTGRYALFWILSAMALENKVDNVPPNLSGHIVQAVLTGSLYPATMLQQTIRRVRATRDVTRMQAGILKAYLNRYYRIHSTKEKEITVALDTANNNPGYRLGRLFAVLEKIQEEANPGLNATIRDRFYGAASSSPVTVFPQLLKLKNHHLAKLENVGRKINFERMLTEIFDGIGSEMPSHLAMEDQSRFAIGYYHQRQALFTSSSNNENKKEG